MRKHIVIFLISLLSISGLVKGQTASEIKTFFSYLEESRWAELHHFFENQEKYHRFLSSIFPEQNNAYSFAPLKLKFISDNKGYFINIATSESLSISIKFDTTKTQNIVQDFEITKSTSQNRLEAQAPYNFSLLPSRSIDFVDYMDDFNSEFNSSGSVNPGDYSQEALYRQINFQPLKLKFNYCRKVLFFNKCGKSTYTKEFGLVLSDKDLPENEDGKYETQILEDIKDITSFRSVLSTDLYNPTQGGVYKYVLTSVIIDGHDLVIFREGLNPWRYGDKIDDIHFMQPIAVKALGNYVYVLEKGNSFTLPRIQVFQVFNDMKQNSDQGDFGIRYISTIDASNVSGFQLNDPVDLGGYLTPNEGYLLVADANGIHQLKIDKSTGKYKNFYSKVQVLNSPSEDDDRPYQLNEIIRIDARDLENPSDLGCIVILGKNADIVSLTSASLLNSQSTDNPNFFIRNYAKDSDMNNLAYMSAEKKWYITDYGGKLHKLDKDGRYIGGGGIFGTAEGNNELYYPNAITPNPIGEDSINDFRYRFMVASKWGYETGVKLFSPGIFVSKLKAFENLNDGKLTFAFTMSGKWGYIEGANSIQMQFVKINGTAIKNALWNTQIEGGIQTKKSTEFLNHFPETITLKPDSISDNAGNNLKLKRGWNTFTVQIEVKKILEGQTADEIVTKTIDFYWLPSTFDASASSPLDVIKINNSPSVSGVNKDYIYKPITMGANSVFYNPTGHDVFVSDYGNLNLLPYATIFNQSLNSYGLGNFYFKDNGKIRLSSNSYICAQGKTNGDMGYGAPDFTRNLAFDPGYKKGIYPTIRIQFPGDQQNQCKSACEFLTDVAPAAVFKAIVDLSNSSPFKVTVDPSGSSYYNKVKWEVEEIGNPTKKALIFLNSTDVQIINLNEKLVYNSLPYTFLSCKDYKITLSLGCNDDKAEIQWITSSSQIIGIYKRVLAGPDQFACEYDSPLQMTGATPIPVSGDLASSKWMTGRATAGMPISLTGVITLSTLSSTLKNKKDSVVYSYTDRWNCTKTATKYVTIYSRPATPASFTSNSPVCEGKPLNLTTSSLAGATYKWVLAGNQIAQSTTNTTSIIAEPSMSGTAKAIVIKNGCSSLDKTGSVTVNPLPVITISDSVKHMCLWGQETYYPTAQVSPVNGTGVLSGYNVILNSGSQKYYFQSFGLPVKDYGITYTYTAPSTGCQNSAKQTIRVGPEVKTTDETVCNNSPIMPLSAIPSGGTWYEYDLVTIPPSDFNPATQSAGSYSFYYQYTNAHNCSSQIHKLITVKPTPQSSLSMSQPEGLRYKYYENIMAASWTTMPDFSRLMSLKEGVTGTLDISNRLRDTQYGFVFEGFVTVPATGVYSFYLSNIDGAKLYLDSTLLTNSDGVHATLFSNTKTKTLTKGQHAFKIEYFNTNGNGQLMLEWQGPGIARQTIPAQSFNSPITFCEGSSINLSGSDDASPSISYLWSNGSTQNTINISESGNYHVTVKNADGCSSKTNTIAVLKIPSPDANILRQGGLSYSYYENDGTNYTTMPNFATLTPIKTGYAKFIDASLRNRNTKTALVFEGYIMTSSYGDYTFYTSSDKNSRLYIDDLLIIDNTTPSTEKSGTVKLRDGSHKIKVTYFNTNTTATLSVSYQGPGITKKIIPSNVLYNDLTICESNSNVLGAKYAASYLWSIQLTSFVISPAPGNHSVTLTGVNGCKSTGRKTVYANTPISVRIATSSSKGVCIDSAFLIADPQVGQTPFTYQWSKNLTDISNSTSQTLTARTDGKYGVKISDGCFKISPYYYYNLSFLTTPIIELGTDIIGTRSVCETGGSASILVDIQNYNPRRIYKVSLSGAGAFEKIIDSVPVLTMTETFPVGQISSRWRRVNKASSIASTSTINSSGQLALTGTHAAISPTSNSMVALSRLDLRGDLDINVKVISYTNSGTSAKVGLFVANDIDIPLKGGYCILSACKDGKLYFQYDKNGDGTLEKSYATPAVVNQTNL